MMGLVQSRQQVVNDLLVRQEVPLYISLNLRFLYPLPNLIG